ncbi:immunoglobulin-like domain-containing protein [Oerskovia sp. M15]
MSTSPTTCWRATRQRRSAPTCGSTRRSAAATSSTTWATRPSAPAGGQRLPVLVRQRELPGHHLRRRLGAEQNTVKSPSAALARGVWKTVTYTLGAGTGRLYEDGAQVGENTAVTHTPGAIGNGRTTANYLGKSAYAADNLFKGRMKDFRLYDRALTATEVADLSTANGAASLTADVEALSLGDTSAVVTNLTLPAKGSGGSTVTWATSDASVVTSSGTITRPEDQARTATLTATLAARPERDQDLRGHRGARTGDQGIADAAAAALEVKNLDDVRGNLTLPTTGTEGTTVTWATTAPTVVSPAGDVTRPAHGTPDQTVTLTATVTKGSPTPRARSRPRSPRCPRSRTTPLPVLLLRRRGLVERGAGLLRPEQGQRPAPVPEPQRQQARADVEPGRDRPARPVHHPLPEGDKFYQIATDLKIYGNGNWDASQRTGSKSIMVWESTDLVNWTDQRLVKVSPDTAGNTWAPRRTTTRRSAPTSCSGPPSCTRRTTRATRPAPTTA